MERHQVVVVGGGPVGLALAVDLGRRGIDCAVVERRRHPSHIPKGQNLTQRSLEHFYFWGCVDELRAARLLPRGYPIGSLTAYGSLMSLYWYAPPGREVVQPYYFQENERLPQYLTETVLRNRLRELDAVTGLFGWTAVALEQDDREVCVTLLRDDDRTRHRVLTADYLVGCDGARSWVRERAGIACHGRDLLRRMVLAVFRSRQLHEALRRFPERTTYRVLRPELEGYWQFFGRVDVGEGWFFHAPVPDDVPATDLDLHGLLERAAGTSFACAFEHVGFWELRIAVADRYRRDRILVAGDACHSHPPYGGFGLNTGLEDAANLSWKLAAVLQGWGGEALLDSYQAERRPIALETTAEIAAEIERDRAFLERYRPDRDRDEFERAWTALAARSRERVESYEPHYEGSPVVAGIGGSGPAVHGHHSPSARPGHHLTPQPLSSGRNVYEELGSGFTLLAFGVEERAVRPFQAAAEALHVPLRVLRDSYRAGRRSYGSRLILVRPDQHVAWVGDRPPPDAGAVIRKVVGLG
ncbi:MAG TPA: FAD-dependent monooxygenase [Candidatus Dormibacteraeota bacterium]|nr:FAD-dependent monooxygenase [Candidatus Dormibacteraeota bacterium]